jgi:hypothetical protein
MELMDGYIIISWTVELAGKKLTVILVGLDISVTAMDLTILTVDILHRLQATMIFNG